jgi:hypothetical protein
MNAFRVWVRRSENTSCLRVEDCDHAQWLLRRLSQSFVFKTSEPITDGPNSLGCTFSVAHTSQMSSTSFARLLAGIPEVQVLLEPA